MVLSDWVKRPCSMRFRVSDFSSTSPVRVSTETVRPFSSAERRMLRISTSSRPKSVRFTMTYTLRATPAISVRERTNFAVMLSKP